MSKTEEFNINLALSCGRGDWKRFMSEMSHDEYDSVVMFVEKHRIGQHKEDFRFAHLISTVAATAGVTIEVDQLMELFGHDRRVVSGAEIVEDQRAVQRGIR